MLEPTEGRFTVEAAIPGVARTGDEIVVDPNARSIFVTRRVSWSKYPELMGHLRPAEPLLPMMTFEAMADVLRPLATGLGGFDYESDSRSFFVDESDDLTGEGERLLVELATTAAEGARRLGDLEGKTVHRLLPDWCERQLGHSDPEELLGEYRSGSRQLSESSIEASTSETDVWKRLTSSSAT